jgi:methylase of polypeptide subunit release factors
MNNEKMSIPKREDELLAYLDKQPYETKLDGINLTIARNVFPSDFGLTSSFVGGFMLQQKPGESALDMGCGSGYFAFLLKQIGSKRVMGVDYNRDAVDCASANLELNPDLAPIQFIHSDLFADVPPRRFDLIMFNFNYYPSNGLYGLNADGGQEILRRFFTEVVDYSDGNTRIYIPYSEFVGAEHDPKNICVEYGFAASTRATTRNQAGEHYIYEVARS